MKCGKILLLWTLGWGLSWFGFYYCGKHHDQKQEERVYFIWIVTIHHWERPRQEVKAAAWNRKHKTTLFTGWPPFLCSPNPSTWLSRLNSPVLINNKENAPTDMPRGQSETIILHLRLLPPKCVKLTTEISHHRDFILDYPGRSRVIARFILVGVCEACSICWFLYLATFPNVQPMFLPIFFQRYFFVSFWDSLDLLLSPHRCLMLVAFALPVSFPSATQGDGA